MRLVLVPLALALIGGLTLTACGGAPEKPEDREGVRDRAAAEDRDLDRKLDRRD